MSNVGCKCSNDNQTHGSGVLGLTFVVQGLLDIISRIEKHIDQTEELSVLLQHGGSEYKLIDANFCEMTRKQWIITTNSENPNAVFLRLLKVPKTTRFNVAYSEELLADERTLVFQLATFQLMIERSQKELKDARRNHQKELKETHQKLASSERLVKLEASLRALKLEQRKIRTRRIAQRFRLFLVRYHLIDPGGQLWDEDEVYLEEIRQRKPFTKLEIALDPALQPKLKALSASSQLGQASSVRGDRERAAVQPEKSPEISFVLPDSAETGVRDTVLVKQVLDQFQAPTKKSTLSVPVPVTKIPTFRISDEAMEEINSRFRPPRRSATSQTLIPVSVPPQPMQRSQTLDPSVDIEAQTRVGKRSKGVSFAPSAVNIPTTAVHVASTTSKQAGGRMRGRDPTVPSKRSSYIFRSRITPGEDASAASLAITPLRLPPARHRLTNVETGTGILSDQVSERNKSPSSEGPVLSALTASRKEKDLKSLQPFFEWRASPATPSTPRSTTVEIPGSEVNTANGVAFPDSNVEGIASVAGHTLDILHLEMKNPYFLSEESPIQPQQYLDIEEKTIHDAVKELEAQSRAFDRSLPSHHPSDAQKLWETKLSILLKVDIIMSCFIGNNELPSPIVRKIWGIILNICRVPLEEVR